MSRERAPRRWNKDVHPAAAAPHKDRDGRRAGLDRDVDVVTTDFDRAVDMDVEMDREPDVELEAEMEEVLATLQAQRLAEAELDEEDPTLEGAAATAEPEGTQETKDEKPATAATAQPNAPQPRTQTRTARAAGATTRTPARTSASPASAAPRVTASNAPTPDPALSGQPALPAQPALSAQPAQPAPREPAAVTAHKWLKAQLAKLPPGVTVAPFALDKVHATNAFLTALCGGDRAVRFQTRDGGIRCSPASLAHFANAEAAATTPWPRTTLLAGADASNTDAVDAAEKALTKGKVVVVHIDGVADARDAANPIRIVLVGPAGVVRIPAAGPDGPAPVAIAFVLRVLQNAAVLKVRDPPRFALSPPPTRLLTARTHCVNSWCRATCWPTSCTFSAPTRATWSTPSRSTSPWTHARVRHRARLLLRHGAR